MTEIDFKPLVGYLDEKFGEQDQKLDKLQENLVTLQTSVDNLAKMVKDYRDEHVIIHRRLEVLEQWAKQVAAKLGISLPF